MLVLVGLLIAAGAAGYVVGRETGGDREGGGVTPTAAPTTPAGGDPEAGAAIFASAGCGGCHAFEPAGSTAQVGPALDGTVLTADQVAQVVDAGRGAMPAFADRLTDEEIADVAAYVTAGGP
jgi:mono/diheme cytochrome c family protein